MGERDLPCENRSVLGHVCEGIVESVLKLDVHAGAKLLNVERRCGLVDSGLLVDVADLVGGKALRTDMSPLSM